MQQRSKEMFEGFQLEYNNLASNLAPGLTKYEISVYLTKAYHTLVESLAQSYERNETARKALIELVDTEELTPRTTTDDNKIVSEALFFALPDNVLQVVFEALKMSENAGKCLANKQIQVLPVKHDQFDNIYNDSFRFTKYRALRLDVNAPVQKVNSSGNPILDTNNNPVYETKRCAEIVSKNNNVSKYKIRYIRKPGPIILDNLTNDSICGETQETTSELNTMYDKDIIKLAAQLAWQDYKAA